MIRRLISRTQIVALALFATIAFPLVAIAHDGHGSNLVNTNTPLHYLTEPIHVVPLLGILLAASALTYWLIKLHHSQTSAN